MCDAGEAAIRAEDRGGGGWHDDPAGKRAPALAGLDRADAGSRGAADDGRGRGHVRASGQGPGRGDPDIFWDPLFGEFAFYYAGQLLVKAGPLILIAIGLSLGFKAGIWNIGAEGQYIIGAICGAGWAGLLPDRGRLIFPADGDRRGALGGWAWAMIPADPEDPVRHQRDPGVADAGLCGRAHPGERGAGAAAQPRGRAFPARNLRAISGAANPS
jgi:hypothetical protein